MQLVAQNEESLIWRMTFRVTLGQSTNGRVFNKSVSDIVCGVESVVHQDARYKKCRSVFTDRYCVWKKSGIVDVENDVRSYIGSIHERQGIQ